MREDLSRVLISKSFASSNTYWLIHSAAEIPECNLHLLFSSAEMSFPTSQQNNKPDNDDNA